MIVTTIAVSVKKENVDDFIKRVDNDDNISANSQQKSQAICVSMFCR